MIRLKIVLRAAFFLIAFSVMWRLWPIYRVADPEAGHAVDGSKSKEAMRANAVIVVLARNSEINNLNGTLAQFEDTFNGRFHYPYVFLNEQPFDEQFKATISKLLIGSSSVQFGLIPKEHWSYPTWINQTIAADCRKKLEKFRNTKGGFESYHHMCRFNSGFFYRHPLLEQYEYYWRIEPSVKFSCRLDYDPFLFMMQNGIQYGFIQMMPEYMMTIPTLWNETITFLKDVYPKLSSPAPRPASPVMRLLLDDGHGNKIRDEAFRRLAKASSSNYASLYLEIAQNFTWLEACHFWSNFEIASLNFYRSPFYQAYFDHLDKAGGFFYERWGDAPIHALAVGMFLDTKQIHHFSDIGYQHGSMAWCPRESSDRCNCDVNYRHNMAGTRRVPCAARFLDEMKTNLK